MDIPYFIYSSVDEYVSCFHFWLLMLLGTIFFISTPFSVLLDIQLGVKLLGYMVILCNQNVLHSSCTILHFHQQCIRVPVSFHPHQQLLFSTTSSTTTTITTTIPVGIRWYLTIALICISLVINDIKHLFRCLMVICISGEMSIHALCPFLWILIFKSQLPFL